jgi:hypothetical protein
MRQTSESNELYERLQEKRARRLRYQKQYRSDDYAKLHRQIWNQQHPNYYAQWQQRNPGYHREYCRQWRAKNPTYTMNKNN